MLDKHHIAHYVIAGVIACGLVGAHEEKINQTFVPTSEVHEVTHVRVGSHDWPELTEQKQIDLGEALNKLNKSEDKQVTLFCSAPPCINARESLHHAFAIGWWGDEYEDVFVESEYEHGIAVGPPGEEADAVAKAIHSVTGWPVHIVGISDIKGSVGIIFGKYDGN